MKLQEAKGNFYSFEAALIVLKRNSIAFEKAEKNNSFVRRTGESKLPMFTFYPELRAKGIYAKGFEK